MISWLKLDINILDDAKIKIIRSHPDGNSVFVLWIGLLCLAMKSQRPGIIEISEGLPYSIDDLGNMFSVEKKTVEMAVALFCKYRMVDVFEDGSLEITNFLKHQKLDVIERQRELSKERVKKHRDKLRICNALPTRDSVTVTITDKDLDKDLDKDKDKTPPTPRKRRVPCANVFFDKFWTAYPKKKAKPDAISAFAKINPDETLLYAILEAIDKAKQSDDWQRDEGRYVPYPATWLNGQRWTDEGCEVESPLDAWTRKKQAEIDAEKEAASNGTVRIQ